jgi:hypothetical protein
MRPNWRSKSTTSSPCVRRADSAASVEGKPEATANPAKRASWPRWDGY